MSDFTSKDHKGLLEAYHSIYNKKEEVVEELNESVEETLTEDYDINILLENVKDYLVISGYVDTEDQAYNIMPHMTEEFFGSVIGEMYAIATCMNMKEYLISEGCEVEDYTIEDMHNLFENYVKENLNEEAITAAVATSPWWVPAALTAAGAVGTYLTNKDRFDRLGTSLVQKATDAVKGASDFVMQARKAKPAKPGSKTPEQVKAEIDAKERARAERAAERKAARDQAKANQNAQSNQPSTSSSSSPNPDNQKPPKKDNWFGKVQNKFNQGMQNLDKWNKNMPKPTTMPNYIRNLPGAAWGGLKNLKTIATAGKNLAFGKGKFGLATRVIGSGIVDQVGLRGAIQNKINQGLQTNILKGRLWGADEIEKDTRQGEADRREILDKNKKTRQPNNNNQNKGFTVNPDGSFTYR